MIKMEDLDLEQISKLVRSTKCWEERYNYPAFDGGYVGILRTKNGRFKISIKIKNTCRIKDLSFKRPFRMLKQINPFSAYVPENSYSKYELSVNYKETNSGNGWPYVNLGFFKEDEKEELNLKKLFNYVSNKYHAMQNSARQNAIGQGLNDVDAILVQNAQ